MTKKWTNLNLPGVLHYVTGIVRHRIPIFKQEKCCSAFIEVCAALLRSCPSKLIVYVIMPDHFHLIVNPRDGDIRGFAGALKSLLAPRIIEITNDKRFNLKTPHKDGSIHQVWQDSFKAVPLWSDWMIWQKINYIHANPVRVGLVNSAKDYKWSSFRAFYLGADEPISVDHDWWWPEDSVLQEQLQKKPRAGASPSS